MVFLLPFCSELMQDKNTRKIGAANPLGLSQNVAAIGKVENG
jgi:hypothetical protein